MDLSRKRKWWLLLQPTESKTSIQLCLGKRICSSSLPEPLDQSRTYTISYLFPPSRFDSMITFDLPDQQTREAIVTQYAKHLTKSETAELARATEE